MYRSIHAEDEDRMYLIEMFHQGNELFAHGTGHDQADVVHMLNEISTGVQFIEGVNELPPTVGNVCETVESVVIVLVVRLRANGSIAPDHSERSLCEPRFGGRVLPEIASRLRTRIAHMTDQRT